MIDSRFVRQCRRSIPIVLGFSAVTCLANFSLGQSNKCNFDHKDHVKYKLVQSYKTDFPPYLRSLRIVVKQKNISRDYMLLVARTIRRQFCMDDEISALIFDSERVAKTMDEGQFLTGKIKVPEVRGFYTLANQGKDESIEYSTQRGNSYNEVRIRLSPD